MRLPAYSRIVYALLAFALIFTFPSCGLEDEAPEEFTETVKAETETDSGSQRTFAETVPQEETDGAQAQSAPGQRGYRVKTRGNGEDIVTLMIYLCGSDLESEGGAATDDLIEILEADIGENLNVIVETGGALEWNNAYIDPATNQRWQIADGDLHFLADAGLKDMSKGETLTGFIKFCAENFPADRYMLVLWDHGGGTVEGYAYDERFESDGMMPISELNRALAGAGVVFDMIGFDCCLMGTAETAFMVEKYADYMVASQRVEPGDGWHYTPWVDALSKNTSIPTLDLGKAIADSFIAESRGGEFGNELTLSVIDLTYIPDLFNSLYVFFEKSQSSLVDENAFFATSRVLGSSRAVTGNYDLVDLAYLIGGMDGSEEVLAKLAQCVAYNNATIRDYNGLCLYFPYTDLSKVGDALLIYRQIGIEESYRDFITTFANLMVGGQAYGGGGTDNPLGGDGYDRDYWLDLDWVDGDLLDTWGGYYEENSYDGSELAIDLKGDGYVLSLSGEDRDMITAIEQRVFLDDGEGYIDLGSDAVYGFDGDGDLMIEFDNTWVALDGELICFYTSEEYSDGEKWHTHGVAPVLYKGREAEIVIMWDNDNPGGYAAGWRYVDAGAGSQRGLFSFEDGMTFEILCDYYTYGGDYLDQFLWGELTVNGRISVSYEDVGDADCLVYYELYDIYRNTYWTEAVVFGL